MSLQSLTAHYASLLAYQYRGLPNADRQVKLWASQFLAENLVASLLQAFDIETAVGTQLDILGKYVGVARNIGPATVRPYFGLWTYAEATLLEADYQGTWDPTTNTPTLTTSTAGFWWVADSAGTSTAPLAATFRAGDVIRCTGGTTFVRYTDAGVYPYSPNTPNGNGLTSYASPAVNPNGIFYQYDFASGQNTLLTDAQYRACIKLKIILNSCNHTLFSIQAYLLLFFGSQITLVDNTDMTLDYTVVSTVPLSPELLAIFLPRPMGVGITINTISPVPESGEALVTEDGFTVTTEDAETIITDPV